MITRKKSKRKSSSLKVNSTFFYSEVSNDTRYTETISDKKFFIPSIEEYELLLNYNYKIKQLQQICKYYKLKTTGKKSDLTNNIYNYLRLSFFSIKIQKHIKGYLQRVYNFYRGPAYFRRSLCTNHTDFLTMEELSTIDSNQFISFKNKEGYIYGFDITSLYNLILKKGKKAQNPYDRALFPHYLFQNIEKIIKLSPCFNIELTINLETEDLADKKKYLEFKLINIFQKIDEFGFITQLEWFNNLSRTELLRYIRELCDIWNYRAQLSNEVKRSICPPHGNPFSNVNSSLHILANNNLNQLRLNVLRVMENLIKNGINNENKSLGAFYVLSALTLVSPDAAESLPWLYQSVMHNS
jgi:hypothetical protein